MPNRKRLAPLASGSGTTVEAILDARRQGRLPLIEPAVLITDRPGAGVVERTRWFGIPHRLVERKSFGREEFGYTLLRVLEEFGVDIVGQFGWLSHTPVNTIDLFTGMAMINQHPGPVPWFGGKGMWGKRPHAAVLRFRELVQREKGRLITQTRVVAQFVDPRFDQGGVIHYNEVSIEEGDTPETLQRRALPYEWETQIRALEIVSSGVVHGSSIYYDNPFVREGEEDLVAEANQYALTTQP